MKASDSMICLPVMKRAMVLSAEMQFQQQCEQNQEAGFYGRLPGNGQQNLEWTREYDTMKFSTEAVPYDKWPIKPNV